MENHFARSAYTICSSLNLPHSSPKLSCRGMLRKVVFFPSQNTTSQGAFPIFCLSPGSRPQVRLLTQLPCPLRTQSVCRDLLKVFLHAEVLLQKPLAVLWLPPMAVVCQERDVAKDRPLAISHGVSSSRGTNLPRMRKFSVALVDEAEENKVWCSCRSKQEGQNHSN